MSKFRHLRLFLSIMLIIALGITLLSIGSVKVQAEGEEVVETQPGDVLWTTLYDYLIVYDFFPVYYQGKLYMHGETGGIGSEQRGIFCFDAETGDLDWQYTTGFDESNAATTSPQIYNDKLYYLDRDAELFCLDLEGNLLWSEQLVDGIEIHWYYHTTISDDKIYFGADNEMFYCYDISDANRGVEVWTKDFTSTYGYTFNTPIISGDNIYVSCANHTTTAEGGKYVCLDKNTGVAVWEKTALFDIHTFSLIDNKLICKTYNYGIKCFSTTDGEELWGFNEGGLSTVGDLTVYDDYVYFSTSSEGLFCLNLADGTVKWQNESIYSGDYAPVVVNDRLYCCNSFSLLCLNPLTGNTYWTESGINGSSGGNDVFVANNKLFIGKSQKISCVDVSDSSTGGKDWVMYRANYEHTGSYDGGTAPSGGDDPGPGGSDLSITTDYLPGGYEGVFYNRQLEATGGTTPYTWSLYGEGLPTGLTISENGVLSGTPQQQGEFSFRVMLYDADNNNTSTNLTIIIGEEAGVFRLSPTTQTVSVGETYQFRVIPSSGEYTWTSSDRTVATVDNWGNCTALSEGYSYISVYNYALNELRRSLLVVEAGSGSTSSNFSIYYPYLVSDAQSWGSYLTFVNTSDESKQFRLVGYDIAGTKLGSSEFYTIPALGKRVVRISEPDLVSDGTFGTNLPDDGQISVAVETSDSSVKSIAVMESVTVEGSSSDLTINPVISTGSQLSGQTVELFGSYNYKVFVMNTATSAKVYTVTLYDDLGNIFKDHSITIEAENTAIVDVNETFEGYFGNGWITVTSSSNVVAQLVATNLRSTGHGVAFVPFQANTNTTLLSPLVVNLPGNWQTNIAINSNTTNDSTVTLSGFKTNGDGLGSSYTMTLIGNQAKLFPVSDMLFGEAIPDGLASTKCESSGPISIQQIFVGQGQLNNRDLIILNGQSESGSTLVAPQIYVGAGVQTYIAVRNLGIMPISMTYTSFSTAGTAIASEFVTFGSYETRVDSLEYIMPTVDANGWLKINAIGTNIVGEIFIHNDLNDTWTAYSLYVTQ